MHLTTDPIPTSIPPGSLRHPAWIPCSGCDDHWCRIHEMHAHECPCPVIEDWETDPYSDGGPPPAGAEMQQTS